jgi:hypothetical protein
MNKAIFHRIQSILLIVALAFGQVGVNFLHNKHDAHETVIDLDHTVLVKHGEHCKVCAVDLTHQVLAPDLNIELAQTEATTPVAFDYASFTSFSRLLTKDRAPPAFA